MPSRSNASVVPLLRPLALLTATGIALACVVAPLAAQGGRGGRGRAPEIVERVGCFFTDVPYVPVTQVAGAEKPAHPFTAMAALQDAKTNEQPALLYLFDPNTEERKLQQYEQTLFGNDDVGIALRCFRCIRVDVTSHQDLAKYAARAPVHVAFAADGKLVGEVAHTGNKASVSSLTKLLEKAANGHVKPSLSAFVKTYADLVRDLERLTSERRMVQERLRKIDSADAGKHAELDTDLRRIAEEEKVLLEKEKKLLEQVKPPPRDPDAKRLGERRRFGQQQ